MKRIEILHDDDLCLVLNKPAGLAVQGGKGVKISLDKILAETWTPPPLLVHRLDKDTSGIILVAKTREGAALFSRLFVSKLRDGVIKQYIAVCLGTPDEKEGSIREDLGIRDSVKKSQTLYRVKKSGPLPDNSEGQFSVLEIELATGRMHQIRRHLSMIGNPILGDDKYGDFLTNKNLRKSLGLKRMLLHASRLVIPSLNLDLTAALPDYFSPFV